MALFGAPLAQEGHAILACEAALSMQEAFPPQEGGLRLRIGLHSGEVVSELSAGELSTGGAHGSTIHLASRLQQIAEPGGTCITKDCHQLVRSCCDVRSLGLHALKGFPEPLEIYSLLGFKPAVASQHFRGANLTSFRGRDPEIAMLQRALRRAESAEAAVIGLSGVPGAGKSRLCFEFAQWCRGRLIPVVEARALLYGHATPFQPVLEFLRVFCHIAPSDDATVAGDRIRERLSTIGPTFDADFPLVCEFLGLSHQDSAPILLSLTPKARLRRLLDIIRHMVRQGSTTTSVIIVEDLHWLDEASEDFVATLVDAVEGTRTMLVLTFRPGYAAPWMSCSYYKQIALVDLTPTEADDLVRELIGDRPELREICQRIAERSGGNPFFAEELVRSLAENGSIFGDPGDYLLGFMAAEGALPTTVQAVIGARIDRLRDVDKAILQLAAVIGAEFPRGMLEKLAPAPPSEIESSLDSLCDAELLQRQAARDGIWFEFRHPLIQEVAYGAQLKTHRSLLHAAVAQAMEQFYEDRTDEFSGLIAYHYEAAGHVLQAAKHAARAAIWVGSTHSAQAIKHWGKVRSLLQTQPRCSATDELRIMASGQLAWLGWREGLTANEGKPFIDEALTWSRETDNRMIPLLLLVDGRITVTSGGAADTYVGRVKEGLSLLKEGIDIGRMATLNVALSQAYGWAGMLNEALAANSVAMDGISRIEKFDHQFLGYSVEHWALGLRGRILVRLGRFEEAAKCFDLLLGIEEDLQDPTARLIPHLGYVDLAWCFGDPALAERHALRLAQIAEKHQSPYLQVFALACMGTAKCVAGDFTAAVHDLVAGVEYLRKTKAAMEYEPEILASLADCHDQNGDAELAMQVAREAIQVAQQRNARLPECRASITLGKTLIAAGGACANHEAAALFARADQLMRMTGACIYEPLLAQARKHLPISGQHSMC
ncbi:putative Adenylate cyclase [Bradyrhizobium sp. ORS 285]|uniref:ATP-binding protein n=1 Tax=Bradyrhizobium sp. ORS 285 TaxID=115808 RepID=UPI0002406178|nr:AAA family ATPase [Bradyrhizobium sp. ORS 285]CCD84852.1 putative Adenylate cyclase [Bradyrhizobium sp. ORS 285]SMX55657.1 putative Adenylate cyclase [Bradyrhizobium sp. ORS 285]